MVEELLGAIGPTHSEGTAHRACSHAHCCGRLSVCFANLDVLAKHCGGGRLADERIGGPL
jgi:hypothetical protein